MAVDQLLETERAVADTVRRLSFLQYLIMQRSADFGSAGRERVTAGFARHILGLPDNHILSGEDHQKFYLELENATKEFSSLSEQALKEAEQNTGYAIGEDFIRKDEMGKLNDLLEQKKSNHRIFYAFPDPKYRMILFGPTSIKTIGQHTVLIMESETGRTPSAILPLVAAHGEEHKIVIRREALSMIYWEKWDPPVVLPGYSPEVDLRENWKDLTLKSYQRDKKRKSKQLEKIMVDEMIETTAVHETAHGALRDKYQDKTRLALGRLLYAMPYSFIMQALDEILAEWMPKDGVYSGAIPYIASLAEKGKKDQALRLFYRYISDSWFLGNWDQAYLNDLTDLFISSLIPYIADPENVDFEKILKDAEENFNFFMHWWDKLISGTLEILKNAKYHHRGFDVTFDALANAQHESFMTKGSKYPRESEIYQRYFWENMLHYLEKIAPADFTKLKKYFTDQTEAMKKDLLAKLTDRAEPSANLREWLLKEAKARMTTQEA